MKTANLYTLRPVYIERIKPYIGKNLIKVLVGQRRVGKSYLLLQLMDIIRQQDSAANIIYINKELFEYDSLRDYKDLMKRVTSQINKAVKNYLFIWCCRAHELVTWIVNYSKYQYPTSGLIASPILRYGDNFFSEFRLKFKIPGYPAPASRFKTSLDLLIFILHEKSILPQW